MLKLRPTAVWRLRGRLPSSSKAGAQLKLLQRRSVWEVNEVRVEFLFVRGSATVSDKRTKGAGTWEGKRRKGETGPQHEQELRVSCKGIHAIWLFSFISRSLAPERQIRDLTSLSTYFKSGSRSDFRMSTSRGQSIQKLSVRFEEMSSTFSISLPSGREESMCENKTDLCDPVS